MQLLFNNERDYLRVTGRLWAEKLMDILLKPISKKEEARDIITLSWFHRTGAIKKFVVRRISKKGKSEQSYD